MVAVRGEIRSARFTSSKSAFRPSASVTSNLPVPMRRSCFPINANLIVSVLTLFLLGGDGLAEPARDQGRQADRLRGEPPAQSSQVHLAPPALSQLRFQIARRARQHRDGLR